MDKKSPVLSGETIPTNYNITDSLDEHKRDEESPLSLSMMSPLQSIKAYCRDCSGGSFAEVKLCPRDGVHSGLCPLYRYRTGKTGRTRELTEEQRAVRSQRMKEIRGRSKIGDSPISLNTYSAMDGSDSVVTSSEESDARNGR